MLGVLLLLAAARAVAADACEELRGRTVRWIVPHGAGGGHDTYSRLLVPYWEAALGVQVVVQNESGAGGRVGLGRIRDARPDGTTLGLVNGPGLVAAAIVGEPGTPDLLHDVTLLGQVARIHHIWLTNTGSPLRTFDDLVREGRQRPIVFGLRDLGASSLVDSVGVAQLLDFSYELVAGYNGTASRLLALQRGEIDVVTVSFEASLSALENKRVTPILQLYDRPIGDHAVLTDVPWLGGEQGVAATIATARARDLEQTATRSRQLVALMTLGRTVVAPPRLPPELAQCLEKRLTDVLADPQLREQARRAGLSWAPADAAQTGEAIRRSLSVTPWLKPLLKAAVTAMRE
jgi:tripartite-type tricarboxylate transporter receptor subunit TctC